MEPTAFLNSSGAIVAPSVSSVTSAAAHIFAAPYIEQVALPVVSVDPAALYGDHPENLATLTSSRGAALTFFCDSEAGGTNTGGAGTFDDPWRSLKTASRFLSCNACVLNAAAPYIQLKVKGTVDYHVQFMPFYYYDRRKLIVAGWGGLCDVASADFSAGYYFDLKLGSTYGGFVAASNCQLTSGGVDIDALVDCDVDLVSAVGVFYNCSALGINRSLTSPPAAGAVIYGGSYSYSGTPRCSADYVYSAYFSAGGTSAMGVEIASAAAFATVVASGKKEATALHAGTPSYFKDCNFSALASAADPVSIASAVTVSATWGNIHIQGGTLYASAFVSASGGVSAEARVFSSGFSGTAVVNGAQVTVSASATALPISSYFYYGAVEIEGGIGCTYERIRKYDNGVLISSTSTSSGAGCP